MRIDESKLNLIRAKRGATRLTEIGVTPRIMKRIKNGEPLQIRTIHKIAAALGVDPEDITIRG